MAIVDVVDLRVYQRALNLLKFIYKLAKTIPERNRKLRRQLIEAAEAIAPLIAEGFAKKRNEREVKRFWEMAMAESDETITHLREVKILAEMIRRINPKFCDFLIREYKIESKQLRTLMKNWNKYPPKEE